tara:strand:+ start:729 stop:1346 length:618 start_codon:yes stop_codon:yes gene_type:complete
VSERGDSPSASATEQIALCPGSHQAQRGLPDTPSKAAHRGTMIHLLLELNKKDFECAVELAAKRDQLIDQIFPTGRKMTKKEERLWLRKDFSGQADHIVTQRDVALIMDYKTGTFPVTPASQNLQLMALAVLLKANKPKLTTIYAAILQPTYEPELVCYDEDALADATEHIESLLEKASAEDAPRIGGDKQCYFCKAKEDCDETP